MDAEQPSARHPAYAAEHPVSQRYDVHCLTCLTSFTTTESPNPNNRVASPHVQVSVRPHHSQWTDGPGTAAPSPFLMCYALPFTDTGAETCGRAMILALTAMRAFFRCRNRTDIAAALGV